MQKKLWQLFLIMTLMSGMVMAGWGSVSRAQAQNQATQASPNLQKTGESPSSGGITFSRRDWVYYLAPGQTQPRELVQGLQPAFSPDSKKIACVQAGEGKGLMLLDLATGQIITLVPSGKNRIDGPAWSLQGQELAFIYDLQEINIIQADGSGRKKIFSVPGGSFAPRCGRPAARACWSLT